jgi:hypothetical protein
MATDQYPNRNVNMPMRQDRVDAARSRQNVPASPGGEFPPADGRGSLREVRKGTWIDDRVHIIGRNASPSKDSPPEWGEGRAVPASYDPLKVYQVELGSPAIFCGRTLSPGKQYQMVGDACTEISASIIDAVELGDIPVSPDAAPSGAR